MSLYLQKKTPDNLNLICVKLFTNKFATSSVNAFAANFPLVILEQIRCLDYLKIVQPDLLKPDEVELATNLPRCPPRLLFSPTPNQVLCSLMSASVKTLRASCTAKFLLELLARCIPSQLHHVVVDSCLERGTRVVLDVQTRIL